MKLSPVLDVRIADDWGDKTFSVEVRGLDVNRFLAPAFRGHLQSAAVREPDLQAGNAWGADVVLIRSGAERVESKAVEYVPGGHLAAVIVAAQRAGLVAVEVVGDVAHPFLALPRLAEPVVQGQDRTLPECQGTGGEGGRDNGRQEASGHEVLHHQG